MNEMEELINNRDKIRRFPYQLHLWAFIGFIVVLIGLTISFNVPRTAWMTWIAVGLCNAFSFYSWSKGRRASLELAERVLSLEGRLEETGADEEA